MYNILFLFLTFLNSNNDFKEIKQWYYFDKKGTQDYTYFKDSINQCIVEMTQICDYGCSSLSEISSIKDFDKDSIIIKINSQRFKIVNASQTPYYNTEGIGFFHYRSKGYIYIRQNLISHSKQHGFMYIIFVKEKNKFNFLCTKNNYKRFKANEISELLTR